MELMVCPLCCGVQEQWMQPGTRAPRLCLLSRCNSTTFSSGRGRAGRRVAALGKSTLGLNSTAGGFPPSCASCHRHTNAVIRPRASLPKLQFCHFHLCTLAFIWSLLNHGLCHTRHRRATEINKICNGLLPYFLSLSWALAWSLSKPVKTLSFLWATALF